MSEDNELPDLLKAWNPMKDDYTDLEFNQYSSGPGADLDPTLQSAQQLKTPEAANDQQQQVSNQTAPQKQQQLQQLQEPKNDIAVPYLVFRRLPKGMTKNAIFNICSRHGHVTHVRDSAKNDFIFVDLKSVADMESVYRALEKNSFGFEVRVGKQFGRKENITPGGNGIHVPSNEFYPPVPPRASTIDMESRKFRVSVNQPPRPYFKNKPILSQKQFADLQKALSQRNDPQRLFLIEEDAHSLERAGIEIPNADLHANSKYKYKTGRAYLEMPEKTRKFIEQKNLNSVGVYDAEEGIYLHQSANATHPSHTGDCSECKRASDIICARCSTYFCSLECQQKVWPKHRFVCGKPKHLQKALTTNNENHQNNKNNNNKTSKYNELINTPIKASPSKPNALALPKTPTTTTSPPKLPLPPNPVIVHNMPRSGNLVTLSAISKTNIVFIRSKTYDDNLSFFKTVSEIQAAAKTLKLLQEPPQYGQIVVARFEGQFSRALVLNAHDSANIKIHYTDYGNLDSLPYTVLYAAPERFVELPRFAMPVILKGVPDCYMTENVRKFMYSYLDSIDLQLKYKATDDYIADKEVYRVELIDEASNQSFNETIAKLCKAVEPRDGDGQPIIYRDYLTQKLLPAGENVKLVVMDNSLLSTGCISCTTQEYALEIQKFQAELQKYGDSLKAQVYAPRADELCIAKYSEDQKWYRGRCLEIVGDGHPTIIFFDYGNIEMVNVKYIRRYPPQFTYPMYTADCEIAGLPENCDDSMVAKLEELVPNGSELCCDRVTVYEEDCFHSITLQRVIHALQVDGLLVTKTDSN